MNVDRILKGRQEAQTKSYSYANKGGNYTFQILGLRNLQPGRYRVRILWSDPVKNPDGMYLVSTSTINVDEGGKKKAIRFLTPDVLPDGEGYAGIPEVLSHLDETGKFDRLKEMGDKTKALREAIVALAPWRRFWMPVFIWAIEKPGNNPSDYSTFHPVDEHHGPAKPLDRVLEMNESIKLIEALFTLFRAYPDLDSAETGRDIYITVGKNRYGVDIDPRQTRLDPNLARFASENYPDLPGLARKFYFRAPGEIASMVQAQWWAKQLESAKVYFPDHVDTSLSDLGDLGSTDEDAPPPPEIPLKSLLKAGQQTESEEVQVEDPPYQMPFDVDEDPVPEKAPDSRPPVRRPPPPPPRRS